MRIENTAGSSYFALSSRIETHLHAAASGSSMYDGITSHSPSVAVEDDVALRLHVDAAEAVHPERVLDAVDVLGRREEAHHVGAAEDQGLAVTPALRHGDDDTRAVAAGVHRP